MNFHLPSNNTAKTAELDYSRRVLVVDDEPAIRLLLQEYFEILGLEVRTAASGQEGWQALQNHQFGLVLCDVSMPGMDGFQLYEQILTDNPNQKFLFISGFSYSDTHKSLVEKSLGLLRKPFTLRDLENAIQNVFPDLGRVN
ncbi:MAG: response regulator [bacterium]